MAKKSLQTKKGETPETLRGRLDEKGREIPDPTPVSLPVGFQTPEPLDVRIQRLVRTQLSNLADEQGYETFEEAEDFEVPDDDMDPATPFEMEFDPTLGREVSPAELNDEARRGYWREQYQVAEKERMRQDHLEELLNQPTMPRPSGTPQKVEDGPEKDAE